MYQIGDRVVYGIHGVCDVVDFEERIIDRKHITYLVLEPVDQQGSRFLVPTNNAVAMGKLRGVLSQSELEEFIRSDIVHSCNWISDENMRKQHYRELLAGGDRIKLMGTVHALYNYREKQHSSGKRCHLSDENFLRDAEKLLAGEIAIILNLDMDQAKHYLRSNLKQK